MFSALGRFDYRFRRVIPVVGLVIMVVTGIVAARFGGELSGGGWEIPGSESLRARELLEDRFGAGRTTMLVVYRDRDADTGSPEFQRVVADSLSRLRDDPAVDSIVTYADVADRDLVSDDRHVTVAVVSLAEDPVESIEDAPRLRALVERPAGIETYVTGQPVVQHDFNAAAEEDLVRAEVVSVPVALVILLIVFGTLVGAALPLAIAALAVPTTFAVIGLLAGQMEMSIFVSNVASMIGLALAIDYSLFMVSRFREELQRGDVATALERTMATVGKAVAVSGIAVAIGLSALIVFEAPALRSMGIGGVVVVVSTLVFGLTVLPALLAILGPRVNRLRLPVPRWLGPRIGEDEGGEARHGVWARIASFVMAHPLRVAVPVLVVLLVAGTPFLHLELSTGGNVADFPRTESRTGLEILREGFASSEMTTSVVAVRFRDDGMNPERLAAFERYADALEDVEGINGVESVLTPPPGIDRAQYRAALAAPASQRPDELNGYIAQWVAGDTFRLELASQVEADSNAGRAVATRIRGVAPPAGADVLVAGVAAVSGDFLHAFESAVPPAVAIVIGITLVVLFLTFGSILLPIKAVLMSLISISASFGALVWIFQDGNLSGLLDFDTSGTVVASTPIIMFAVLFGLSMDYEVLLLSRIRERYAATADNRRAVAEGIGATGGIITGAALIMVGVFGSFALGDLLPIKALGLGMALAVLVDATIVRGVLVPAFMRLMGRWNWWAPTSVQRVVARLGLYEGPARRADAVTRRDGAAEAPAGG
ncbi:MAG: MMPL family transporter [Chloroflexota bacterium]|nr:MMPL family transporter [Chloroflexota bacterium]